MDDLLFGHRDKRGNWSPNDRLDPAPLLAWPPQPRALLKWLPSYFLPWNVLFAVSAWLFWQFLLPSQEVMQILAWPWIVQLFATNCVAVFFFYGAFELKLYIRRTQENRFKYNPKFPSDHQNSAFFFNRQNVDSLIRAFGSGVPIWTAYEVIILHLFATGAVPTVRFEEHPYYLLLLFLILPLLHEIHFYVIHRLIHIPFLYKWVHSVHHNSVNPSGCVRKVL